MWLVDRATAEARRLFHDEDEAWLDVNDDWPWLPEGRELLWVSERDGWRHAWAASRESGELRLLPSGEFDILSVEAVDEERGHLYFTASPEDATRRYFYRVSLDGVMSPERVTPADQPGTHAYDISPDGRFGFHTSSGATRLPPRPW